MKANAINYVGICFLSVSSEKFQYETIEAGLQLYQKTDSSTGVFLWILPNFKNTFFKEHTLATASETITSYSEMWGDDGVIALCYCIICCVDGVIALFVALFQLRQQ